MIETVSLKLARKMRRLGWNEVTMLWWIKWTDSPWRISTCKYAGDFELKNYSAPTTGEIIKKLPECHVFKTKEGKYYGISSGKIVKEAHTSAEVCGELWCALNEPEKKKYQPLEDFDEWSDLSD